VTVSPQEAARRWVMKAEDDLRAARILLAMTDDCPFAIVCFHAQQCAEKYLKALLTVAQHDVPYTHDLGVIASHLGAAGKLPSGIDVSDLATLVPHAVGSRYPDDMATLGRGDAEDAVALAGSVRAASRKVLPMESLL
jgi:HEPN domain-containing protein